MKVRNGKKGERERSAEFAERPLVERTDLADEVLTVEEPHLQKVRDDFAIVNADKQEVVVGGSGFGRVRV